MHAQADRYSSTWTERVARGSTTGAVVVAALLLTVLTVRPGLSQVTWVLDNVPAVVPGPDVWDSAFVGGPAVVVGPGGGYLMLYHSFPFTGCATSVDGVVWGKCANNPILGPTGFGWEQTQTNLVAVLYDDREDLYKMWYTGQDQTNGIQCDIGYATSLDGIVWNRFGIAPVLAAAPAPSWESGCIGGAAVLYDQQEQLYKMWYTGTDAVDTFRIGYATSPDGVVWQKYAGNPVLGGSKQRPTVVFDPVTETYEMWYQAAGSRLGYATSLDGIVWLDHGTFAVPGAGMPVQPMVLRDGNVYHLWFSERGAIQAILHATGAWTLPKASFTVDVVEGVAPLNVAFDAARSASPDPRGMSYAWDFGDDTGANCPDPAHEYPAPGEFRVTLTVTDAAGNQGSVARLIKVLAPPESSFRRGDSNADGNHDIADGVFILNFLFLGREAPPCEDAADANDSGAVDIADASYLFGHLFLGTAAPLAPFPGCGMNLAVDGLTCVDGGCAP